MNRAQFRKELIHYLATISPDWTSYRSLTTIFEEFIKDEPERLEFLGDPFDIDVSKHELGNKLQELTETGLLEIEWGERDYEPNFRLRDQTPRKADGADQNQPNENGQCDTTPITIDSSKWTGRRLVLTDEKVLADIRAHARALRDKIHSIHFLNNADSQDLKSLSDALVSICEMAEPDLTILDRILRHPKFRISAALVTAVATIRSTLGI